MMLTTCALDGNEEPAEVRKQTRKNESWWRRRESNPGPKVLQSGPYVRLRRI